MKIDKENLKNGLVALEALGSAIREAREIPAGTLYAAVMDKLDLHFFNRIVAILIRSGVVVQNGDILKWVQ